MREAFSGPDFNSALILILYNILIVFQMSGVIVCKVYKAERKDRILNNLLFTVTFIIFTLLVEGYTQESRVAYIKMISDAVRAVPYSAVFVSAALLYILSAVILIRLYRWSKNNLSPMSVKEGFDKLSKGICYYRTNGTTELLNHSMDDLCRRITGEALLNGKEFWQRLVDGETENCINEAKGGDLPIISFADGSVFCFTRREIRAEGETVYELTATDISEQYSLNTQLREYNRTLTDVNKQLEYYNEMISDITREKEVLAAKVSIHDKMGKALLATKRYIESGEDVPDKETLLEIWKSNLNFLRNGTEEKEDDSFDEMFDAAALMGIKLTVKGKLPSGDSQAMRIIMCGVRESLTNASHHAGAGELCISVNYEKKFYIVEYTNDGTPPPKTISEGGGLSSLRRSVENSGGFMNTETEPVFVLRLVIPRREEL